MIWLSCHDLQNFFIAMVVVLPVFFFQKVIKATCTPSAAVIASAIFLGWQDSARR